MNPRDKKSATETVLGLCTIVLVALVMFVAAVLALPNVFGEDPALQVERKDRAPMDGVKRMRGVGSAMSGRRHADEDGIRNPPSARSIRLHG